MSFKLKYDQGNIRKYHYFMLLSLIQKNKQLSMSQLAELTKMSNASVGKIIKELIEDGLVIEVGQVKGEVGRKTTILKIKPKGSYIIGVEIDLYSINIACVTLKGEIIVKTHIECDMKHKAETLLDLIAQKIINMIDRIGQEIADEIIAI